MPSEVMHVATQYSPTCNTFENHYVSLAWAKIAHVMWYFQKQAVIYNPPELTKSNRQYLLTMFFASQMVNWKNMKALRSLKLHIITH
jgi:hypothetical protein